MSREIKFRAWDKGIAKMLQVDKLRFDWGGVAALLGGSITKRGDEVWNTHGSFFLMQYTGLKDKNGREIYEGDVLLVPDEITDRVTVEGGPIEVSNHLAPVIFENGSFMVRIMENADCLRKAMYTFARIDDEIGEDQLEVVGNIYENPELVKGDHAA